MGTPHVSAHRVALSFAFVRHRSFGWQPCHTYSPLSVDLLAMLSRVIRTPIPLACFIYGQFSIQRASTEGRIRRIAKWNSSGRLHFPRQWQDSVPRRHLHSVCRVVRPDSLALTMAPFPTRRHRCLLVEAIRTRARALFVLPQCAEHSNVSIESSIDHCQCLPKAWCSQAKLALITSHRTNKARNLPCE